VRENIENKAEDEKEFGRERKRKRDRMTVRIKDETKGRDCEWDRRK
jgi:hypothetical protein